MATTSVLIIGLEENSEIKTWLDKSPIYKVIGTSKNMDLGFTLAERHRPTVIFINIDASGNEGMLLAEIFSTEFPSSTVILITASDNKRILRHALYIGAQGVLNLPIAEEKFHEVLRKTVSRDTKRREMFQKQDNTKDPQFKTIVVAGLKGGVGKTTIATNLAVAIKNITGKRVVLVDLDFNRGHIALLAGVNWNRTIKDLVDEVNDLDAELVEAYCADHPSGIKIAQAPFNPEVAKFIQYEHLDSILKTLENSFNYVIIDTPSDFNPQTKAALTRATEVLLVTTMDVASLQSIKRYMEYLENNNLHRKVKIIVNKMGYSGGIKISDIKEAMNLEPFGVIPNAEKQTIDALNDGCPFVYTHPNSRLTREITELAARIIEKDSLQEAVKVASNRTKQFLSMLRPGQNVKRQM